MTAQRERALWQIVAFALGSLAALVAFEIGLAYGIAYLVTGRAYRAQTRGRATGGATPLVEAPGRIRTCDPRIRSPPLCPLSYGR